jgi:toxin ParE1/3/4
MNIRWAEEAAANLEHISLYIAEDNLEAALTTVNTIYERIEQLSVFPNRGRMGREPGTRELVLSPLPYIVAYRVKESTVEILHIWHGAEWRR